MGLSFDPNHIDLPNGHFIGDTLISGTDGVALFRPSDGVGFADCPIASANQVDEAVQRAKAALKQSGWADARPRERVNALHRWADLIEAEAETLARLEAVASTRPIAQLMAGDIPVTAEQIRFFAEFADKEGSTLVPTDSGHMGMTLSEPYGVVGAITPWNFPINMAGWKLGPALAAGNAVVIKPSEMTPFSTVYLAMLAVKAGIPAGLINVVLGDGPQTGAAITGHPDIAKVSFTGSTRAGAAIMQNIAATGIKPMTLELGGKSPQIVFADADLEKASAAICASIMANAGQACVAGSRLIVEESVSDALLAKITTRLKDVLPKPTWDEAAQFSPIISLRQRARVEEIVKTAMSAGATALTGGHTLESEGYFYAPTVLTNVAQTSPAIEEEIFGPVLTVQTFTREEEAMALADHPTYGLAAGLYTSDISRALRLTAKLQAGTVWVNRYSRSRDHILPTGGYKQSGIGKDLGREAYQANRKSKSVLIGL